MSSQNKKRFRPVNKKGRNKFGGSWVKLEGYLLTSRAYRSMKALPRAVYTELRRRFNGRNNGEISCSTREIAKELHCSKDSASNAFRELEDRGFIKCHQLGSFHYKARHAPTWILTEEEFKESPATKEFMRWGLDEKIKTGPGVRTPCPKKEPDEHKGGPLRLSTVLDEGPCINIERKSRS